MEHQGKGEAVNEVSNQALLALAVTSEFLRGRIYSRRHLMCTAATDSDQNSPALLCGSFPSRKEILSRNDYGILIAQPVKWLMTIHVKIDLPRLPIYVASASTFVHDFNSQQKPLVKTEQY